MHIIVCVDNQNGMQFNGRRQSRDRAVIADILQNLDGKRLRVRPCSTDILPVDGITVRVSYTAPQDTSPNEVCFVEDAPLFPLLEQIESLTIYRWNRDYPGDLFLDLDPQAAGFTLTGQTEFPGYAHERITKEVYTR